MVRLPTRLEEHLLACRSADEVYASLREVNCLSQLAHQDPYGVIALLNDVAREFADAEARRHGPITGGPTRLQSQLGALSSAGYLDADTCDRFNGDALPATIDYSPSAGHTPPSAKPVASSEPTIFCRTCGRQIPHISRYCGYCGIRV